MAEDTGFLELLWTTGLDTMLNVVPLVVVLGGFWVVALRRPLPHARQILVGGVYVLLGITLFLVGLEKALFPLGRVMATQLAAPELALGGVHWQNYLWVYAFAAAIGFATAVAEPSLIAVALKANEVSGGGIGVWGLRIAVGIGAAVGIALGTVRIVLGVPLPGFIIAGYLIVLVQTLFADRAIIPLAYDSGGVTTSTVTVPVVAALGIGLASAIPGRSPLLDGFGLIALACLFPIIAVLAYAQAAMAIQKWRRR